MRRHLLSLFLAVMPMFAAADAEDAKQLLPSAGSLRNAFEMARQYDPLYLAGVSESEGSRFMAQAAGMAYYPQLRAGTYQLENELGGRRTSFSLIQPLLSADKLATLREKEPRLRLADAQLGVREIDLARRLFAALAEIILAREGLQQNQVRLAALEQQQQSARRLSELGMGTVTDVRDADVRLLQARGEDLRLRGQAEQAEKRYRSIVGQTAPARSINLQNPMLGSLPDWVSALRNRSKAAAALIDQNPSVVASKELKNLADIAADRARLAWIPEVNAVHTVTSINGMSNQFTGINLSMPLDAGKFGASQIAGALAAKAAQESRDAERQTLLEIERQNTVLEYGAGEFSMRQAALDAAQFNVLANEKSFKGGVRSIVDVLNSIEILYTAKSDLVKSLLTLADGLLNLSILEGVKPADSLAEVEQILF